MNQRYTCSKCGVVVITAHHKCAHIPRDREEMGLFGAGYIDTPTTPTTHAAPIDTPVRCRECGIRLDLMFAADHEKAAHRKHAER